MPRLKSSKCEWLYPVRHKITEGTDKYLKLQLFVRDLSGQDDNIYTIYLCTLDGRGTEFITIKGKSKTDQAKELKMVYKKMTRPWVTYDLILEGIEAAGGTNAFFIVDTKLTL